MGFAVRLQDEGHKVFIAYKPADDEFDDEPEKKKAFDMVGNGMVEKYDLDKVMRKRNQFKDWYWIWDGNHNTKEGEQLRKEGFKVFGGSELTDKMEHDRDFGTQIAKDAGMDMLPTFDFKNLPDGIKFLQENEDKAYVFKPDGNQDADLTFVPSNWNNEHANHELVRYMNSLDKSVASYILQERVKGVEINVEAWIYQGKPFFAFANFENKRKLNKDAGCNVGCAQDVGFTVPLESQLVKNTIAKLFPYYQKIKYTGFADCNIIISDKGFYFIEFCNRFGYNSHPNLFLNLAKDDFGNIMCDFIDGKIDNFYDRFRYGFGASVSLYLDKPRSALPIYIDKEIEKNFYPYDLYKDNDDYFIAGYDTQVGILAKHGYTIEEAGQEALDCIDIHEEINFPNISYRSDIHKNDWLTSPRKRYDAIKAMNLI